MYKSILVPIDIDELDSKITEKALHQVEMLAQLEDAEVHFISVIPPFPYYASATYALALQLPDKHKIQEITVKELSDFVDKFKIPADKIVFHIEMGSPKNEILRIAEEISADLIVIGSRHPDAKTYFLGSNAAAVVRHAQTSVLVVR